MNKVIIICIFFSSLFFYSQDDVHIASSNFDGEPYIAINPTNDKNIVIAWMHLNLSNRPIRTRTSFDGGLTWGTPVDLPIVNNNTADPTMAFDNSGALYICFIDHLGNSPSSNQGGIYSYKSLDGGLTWGSQALAIDINADGQHQPIDRPWLVCDKSTGPNQGNLYLTTKTVSGGPSPYHPYFMKSTNSGLSWDNWRYVDTINWLSGIPSTFASPTITSNGTFIGIYPSYVQTQSAIPKYIMAYSNDAGNSFDYKSSITNIPSASNDSAKRGWQSIADPLNQDHLGFLYISGSNGDLDIFMTETYDFGDTWTTSERINDDPIGNGILQDLVWASYDEDGDLAVCWRDRRESNTSGYAVPSRIYGVVRWKDSLNFSPNFTISDTLAQYTNILSQAGNDFLCQKMYQDTLYVTWGDTRTGSLNIWFDKIALNTGSSTGLVNLNKSNLPKLNIYPNPSSDFISIKTKNEKIKSVKIFNSSGELIITGKSNRYYVSNLAIGNYLIVTTTDKGNYANSLIIQ